jgi:hypothetical protein
MKTILKIGDFVIIGVVGLAVIMAGNYIHEKWVK